jgi:hypothetical protein
MLPGCVTSAQMQSGGPKWLELERREDPRRERGRTGKRSASSRSEMLRGGLGGAIPMPSEGSQRAPDHPAEFGFCEGTKIRPTTALPIRNGG